MISVNLVATYLQETMVGKTAERILFDLRRAMYVHLQRLSMSFMDKTEVGRIMSRLQGDVGALQEFLDTTVTAIGDILLLAGIVIVLLSLDLQLGLLTLSVVVVLLVVRMIWLPMAKKAFLRARQTSSIVNGALAENVNGVRTVQGMLREGINFESFEGKARDNLQFAPARGEVFPGHGADRGHAHRRAMAIVVVVGGKMVLGGALDLGTMVAFIFYVQRFFDPIRSLTIQYSVMQRAMASGQRIFEVMDVPVDVRDTPERDRGRQDRRQRRAPQRHLRLPAGPAGTARHQLQGAAGRDGGAGRADGLRQDQHHVAHPPLLRRLGRRRFWSAATTCGM